MNDIKQFLENFGEEEYISNVKALDSSITKQIYEEKYDIPAWKYFAKGGENIPYEAKELIEEDGHTEEELKKWQDDYFERFVFQIIEYRNPKLGRELKELFPNVDTVYRCLVSNNVNTAVPRLSISKTYSVVKIDSGLKVIYTEYLNRQQKKFTTPHDGRHLHILNFGEIVKVQNFVVPEEETSLKIFNKFAKIK